MIDLARSRAAVLSMITTAALAACTPGRPATSAPTSSATSQSSPHSSASAAPSNPPSQSPNPSPASDALTIDIRISNGRVDPNGKKIDARRGQTIVLNVTSDADDEIHAHTSDQGYELAVKAGQSTHGELVASQPGRFEVESHNLEKVIVILNVR